MYGEAQEFINEKIFSDKCNLKEGDKARILVNMTIYKKPNLFAVSLICILLVNNCILYLRHHYLILPLLNNEIIFLSLSILT